MAYMRTKLDAFENEALKSMLKTYRAATKEILTDLSVMTRSLPAGHFNLKRAKSLLRETLMMSDAIQKQLANDITGMSVEAGLYSYPEMNNIVSWDGRVAGFNNVAVSATQLNTLITTVPAGGHVLEEWVNRTFADSVGKIADEIKVGYVKGEGYPKLVKRLTKEFGMIERDAITLARTYVQTINVKAATDVYEANSDVVDRVEWCAIMENGNVKTGRGTCPRCSALDSKTWRVDDKSKPPCPLHARCRCYLAPVTKTWEELGFDGGEMEDVYRPWVKRAEKSINVGGVPILDYGFTDKNYADWWATRSRKFQNNAVGLVRANLIRDKNIAYQSIVDDKTGRLFTLEDLIANGKISEKQLTEARKR